MLLTLSCFSQTFENYKKYIIGAIFYQEIKHYQNTP